MTQTDITLDLSELDYHGVHPAKCGDGWYLRFEAEGINLCLHAETAAELADLRVIADNIRLRVIELLADHVTEQEGL